MKRGVTVTVTLLCKKKYNINYCSKLITTLKYVFMTTPNSKINGHLCYVIMWFIFKLQWKYKQLEIAAEIYTYIQW
jgi:hypothetical protein